MERNLFGEGEHIFGTRHREHKLRAEAMPEAGRHGAIKMEALRAYGLTNGLLRFSQ